MKNKKHLPLYGVGPIIVFGQFLFTLIAIRIVLMTDLRFAKIHALQIPFALTGIALIFGGFYLNYCAKMKSKLFDKVKENTLITDGVYSVVRNPVYSEALLVCTGVVLIVNNFWLFFVPVICWIYISVFLIFTEEKWLKNLYGQEYMAYCKKVNRCIPWFPKQ